MILKLNSSLRNNDRGELQETLSKEWNTKVCILPSNLDLVSIDNPKETKHPYKIWTKDDYVIAVAKKGMVCENAIREWERLSNGYGFVIAIYQDNIKDYMMYSVPYFVENIVTNG